MIDGSVLTPILAAYGFSSGRATPLEGGLINQTFLVEEGGRRAVLQRLHPIFLPTVHLDIEAVTAHLEQRGVSTPRLLRTNQGALWTNDAQGGVWRMLTWLEGRTVNAVARPAMAHAAGALVARFHHAVSDLQHAFQFVRVGVHDTAAHLAQLQLALEDGREHRNYEAVASVAEALLRQAHGLDVLPAVPQRIVHGDLKISNVLFDHALDRALALLDLDTFAALTIPLELGDAFRSWCNPGAEDEQPVVFRADLFEAAIAGYAAEAPTLLTAEERASLVLATETIALELAARFCADALRESYFGWNPQKFPSRSAHNLARAASQLALAESVRQQRLALEAVVRRQFR